MLAPSSLRLYLAAVPGDMDGERAVIEGLVLPELRERLHGQGVEIVVVDPAQAKGEEWDLARRFQEIEGCQIFLALLGERYGAPPTTVPLALVAAQPWLVEDPGRSVVELEILHGSLREPGTTASFFYLRNPRFPSMVPEARREQYLPETEEAAARLANLKERIRASGRPVFDGYPCGWSEGLGRASRLDTFAEQVFADLWKAIQERGLPAAEAVPVAAAPSPPEPPAPISVPELPPLPDLPAAPLLPDKPPVLHENVQFTVYRPRVVEPMKWFPLLAFAHLEELPADAPADEPDPLAEIREQAHRILGDLAEGYADVKQDSRQAVPHEAEITFLPEIPGFEVNPPRRTFLWLESVHREEFRIRAGPEMEGRQARGRMSVFWGSILLAEVSLAIRVDSRLGAAPPPPPERDASRPFRNIFPSYSHQDAAIVEEFERYARTLGDRYLRDVHELRAGEVWNDRLKDLIQKADVFQLFWSWNALRSRYVEEEWRYALSLGRSHFVRPTYWEDPLPEEPARSLPPEELRRLHFQLLPGGASSPAAPRRDFDPNATILAFPSAPSPPAAERGAPSLEDTSATAVALPPLPPPPPPLPPAMAAAPPMAPPSRPTAYAPPPLQPSANRGPRRWLGAAAMIALAVIGLSLFALRSRSSARLSSTVAQQIPNERPSVLAEKGPPTTSTPGTVWWGPGFNQTGKSSSPYPVIDPATWQRLAAACRLDAASVQSLPTRFPAGSPIVQVTASEDWIVAAQALSRFGSRGAFLLPLEENGHAVCTVNLGPFPSEEDATRNAAELRVSDGVDAKTGRYPGFTR
ncbi:MAG TPA: TIR domain-containing protein [Thermoanaerobaculia bacterium]|jgi:hypothetical protein|nr:TIR domain-containing protein [Thermoanaerobaculia bacterium]